MSTLPRFGKSARWSAITIVASLCLLVWAPAQAVPITYYDHDFEDGTLGGGVPAGGFGTPAIGATANLDGQSALFDLDDQVEWNRTAADSNTHYVRFDFYGERGSNLTQFLDTPTILRLDVQEIGRHRLEIWYDIAANSATAVLDGMVDNSLLTALVWGASGDSVRIHNQSIGPGNSLGAFEIDNFLWQGNVEIPDFDVPEPATLLLVGLALTGMSLRRRHA